jgi:hypothetical protein
VKDANALRLTLMILALAALICATVLTITGDMASVAWGAFSTIVGALVGQYLPVPGEQKTAPARKSRAKTPT